MNFAASMQLAHRGECVALAIIEPGIASRQHLLRVECGQPGLQGIQTQALIEQGHRSGARYLSGKIVQTLVLLSLQPGQSLAPALSQ